MDGLPGSGSGPWLPVYTVTAAAASQLLICLLIVPEQQLPSRSGQNGKFGCFGPIFFNTAISPTAGAVFILQG